MFFDALLVFSPRNPQLLGTTLRRWTLFTSGPMGHTVPELRDEAPISEAKTSNTSSVFSEDFWQIK